MSIATEITRLQTAKADIKTSLENKGWTVPSSATIDQYAAILETAIIDVRVTAKFNVTDTSNPTLIIGDYSSSPFSAIEIDGVIQPSVVSAYTFSTTGEHTVKYTLTDPTTIGTNAFYQCSGLTSINIPSGVTSIGTSAFQNCRGLTSIDIPSGVTSIGGRAFCDCNSLTSCTIGDGVISIGSNAFDGCSSLTSIVSNATTAPSITSNTFYNVKTGGTLTVSIGSSGYDVWMGTGDYYLGKYNWTVRKKYPSNTIGKVIGTNGNVYDNVTAATNAGTTPAAMISFIGTINGVCENGLAVSLINAYEYNVTYEQATGNYVIPTWASNHTVPNATWRLPSFKDWQYLLIGAYSDSPSTMNISSFNTKLNDCGGTVLSSGNDSYFWTSTEVDANNAKLLYYDGTTWSNFVNTAKTNAWSVRACLSF